MLDAISVTITSRVAVDSATKKTPPITTAHVSQILKKWIKIEIFFQQNELKLV